MERSLWTDERLDDVVDRIDKRLEAIDARFDRMDAKIDDLRRDMHNHFLVQTTAILGLAGILVAHSL